MYGFGACSVFMHEFPHNPEELEEAIAREHALQTSAGLKREVMSTPSGKPSPSPHPKKRTRAEEPDDHESQLLGNDEVLSLALIDQLGEMQIEETPQKALTEIQATPQKALTDIYEVMESPLVPKRLVGTPLEKIMNAETQRFPTPGKGCDSFEATQVDGLGSPGSLPSLKDILMQASPSTSYGQSPQTLPAASDPYSSSSVET